MPYNPATIRAEMDAVNEQLKNENLSLQERQNLLNKYHELRISLAMGLPIGTTSDMIASTEQQPEE